MTTPHGPGPAPPQHDANSSPPPSRSAPDHPFSSPESFVAAVWPHARRVAAKLGVSAKALIAQAALETGWGKHIGGSHNLFGIKANRSWSGDRAELKTTEYVDGAFRRETASFRGYDSIAQSFDDYAHFLASNPRYAAALGVGDDPARFAHELQKAGYATDPAYAAKIARIARSDVFDDALKIPAEQPLLALR